MVATESFSPPICSRAEPFLSASQTAAAIRSAVADAFIFGFRLIVFVSAFLAIASAGISWWKIPAEIARETPGLGGIAAAD